MQIPMTKAWTKNAAKHLTVLAILLISLAPLACSDDDAPPPRVVVPLETMRTGAADATPDMASFLSEIITYASVEPAGPTLLPETEALFDTVLRRGEEMGFSSRRAAGGKVGILEYGAGQEVVGVMIHLDVVPPGDLAAWTHPPFSGAIENGTIYGRGAQDDKGALASVLWGAKILIDNGMTFDRRLRIILGSKEETTFEDTAEYFAAEAPPDFGIAPDAPFIVRAESGYADLIYSFPNLAVPPAEEARDTAVYWDGGTAVNSVPDFSFVVFRSRERDALRAELESLITHVTTEFTVGTKVPQLFVADYDAFIAERDLEGIPAGDLVLYSRGQIAHSSIPSTGRNAIVEVALVGARMTNLTANAFRDGFAFVNEKIGLTTDGSGFALNVEKPIPEAADTTSSLDLADTDAANDRLELLINFRVGVANTSQEVLDKSGAAAAEYGATTRVLGSTFDAYYYPDGHPLLQLAIDSYREVRGMEPLVLAIAATSYAKAAPNFVSYGPIELAEDGLSVHTVNERVPIAALTRNAVLYAHILQKLIQAETAPLP